MPPQHPIEYLAPLAFKAADKFFKFVSWAALIALLRYAQAITNSPALKFIGGVAITLYGASLLMQVFYLAVRSPHSLGIPDNLAPYSKLVQFIISVVFACLIASPYFFLDEALEALQQVQLKPK